MKPNIFLYLEIFIESQRTIYTVILNKLIALIFSHLHVVLVLLFIHDYRIRVNTFKFASKMCHMTNVILKLEYLYIQSSDNL